MAVITFLQNLLRETAALRLSAHCRGLQVTVEPLASHSAAVGTLSERISNINLMGGVGSLALNVHFDLDAAVAFAAHGLDMNEDDIDDSLAIDFVREFSNLHAGFLRGIFETSGIEFGMSLPFVSKGDSGAERLTANAPIRDVWVLRHGDLQICCSSEIDLSKPAAVENVEPSLVASLTREREKAAAGEIDGGMEFF